MVSDFPYFQHSYLIYTTYMYYILFRVTGYVTMKVGKVAAVALGGGIILLQFAHQQGYITIDWNKINNKIDKATDKVEEAVTGQGPSLLDKVFHFTYKNIELC